MWQVLISLASALVGGALALWGSVHYFQGQVDALKDTLGQYALREAGKAAATAIGGVEDAGGQALEAIGARQGEVERAIYEAKADAIAVVSGAVGLAGSKRAVLRLDDYFNRRWCDRTEDRRLGGAYPNDTALPLDIAVTVEAELITFRDAICDASVLVENSSVLRSREKNFYLRRRSMDPVEDFCTATATVPPKATYSVQGEGRVVAWFELSSSPCGATDGEGAK